MRAKSQKHAEYEIVEHILNGMPGSLTTRTGVYESLGPEHDKAAYNRVTMACNKLREELERKQEKLRKYLPKGHADFEEKGEEI